MKCKIFSDTSMNGLEEKINEWINSDSDIWINFVNQTTTRYRLTITIWYNN